jgi:NTP pyrophosphatase (non-canonical NTP hydrolase)
MTLNKMLISENCPIDQLSADLDELGEHWQAIGQWSQPSPERALQFMVTEAGESLDALLRLDGSFTRNNPAEAGWEKVDEEVADTIIMGLRYFAARGLSVEQAIRDKTERMHTKKEFAASQG